MVVILSQFMAVELWAQDKTIFGDDITANSQLQVDEFRDYAKTAMGDDFTPEYEQKLEAVLVKMKALLDKTYLLDQALGVDLGPDELNSLDDAIKEEGYDFTVKSLLQETDILLSMMESDVLIPIRNKISKKNDKEFSTLFSQKVSKGEKFRSKIESGLEGKTFDEKLTALSTSATKLQQKLKEEINALKEAEYKFNSKVTTYVDNTTITMEEIDLLKSKKRLVFAWDVLQYAQYKRYGAVLEAQYEEAVAMFKTAEKLSDLYKAAELSKKDLTTATELTEILYTNSELRAQHFNTGVVPRWMKGIGSSCFNMYLAITIKDSLHLVTNGIAFSDDDPRKKEYKTKNSQTAPVYENGKLVEAPNKYAEFFDRVLFQYVTGGRITAATHLGTLAFVGSAHIIRQFPTSQLMNEYLGVSRSVLSSTTGKIVRGVFGFGISMGVGAKMAEVVGDAVLRWEALFSDDPEIREAARILFDYQHNSAYSWKELGSFITSFGATEAVWWVAGKGLSIPYKKYKLKGLNRVPCDKGKSRLLNVISNAVTKTKVGRFLIGQLNTVALFFVADVVDSRLVQGMFFTNKEIIEHEIKLQALTEELVSAEFNAMATDMVNIYGYYENNFYELQSIYNKYDDYKDLEPYVEILRNNTDKVKACLDMAEYDYVVESVSVSGAAMSYYCLQGFKNGSVDSFIAKYANNPAVRQKAREEMVSNDAVISQEDLDNLKDKAKLMGGEEKKEIEYYEQKNAIPTAEQLTRWNNKDKYYEAFSYAINDGKFTEAKKYLQMAFDLEEPEVPSVISDIIFKAMDEALIYYNNINSDLDTGIGALVDLFMNVYPAMLSGSLSESYGHRATRVKVLTTLSDAYYKKLLSMGYVETDLVDSLCSLRNAITVAYNDYNDAFFLDDAVSIKVKGSKDKIKGLDEVYYELSSLLDGWGYSQESCLQQKLRNR